MYYVYILRSLKVHRFYTGYTKDLENRLREHNAGKVKSTRPWVPWEVVFVKEYPTRAEAMKQEQRIKTQRAKRYLQDVADLQAD